MTDHEHNEVPTATVADAEDTKDVEPEHEQMAEAERAERFGSGNLSENVVKAATEAAYAAVGFAGFVGDKAKTFYEEQQRRYVAAHPSEAEEGAKAFLAQMREQVNTFVEELTKGYHHMAERGRDSRRTTSSEPAARVGEPGRPASSTVEPPAE